MKKDKLFLVFQQEIRMKLCDWWTNEKRGNVPGTKIFASKIRHIAPDCSQAPTPSPEIAPAPANPIKCSEPIFDTNKLFKD